MIHYTLLFRKCQALSNCFSNLLPINDIIIYSNFGNIYNNYEYIDNKFIFSDIDIDFLNTIIDKLYLNKDYIITNRKNISISIKPIQNRNELINKIKPFLISALE